MQEEICGLCGACNRYGSQVDKQVTYCLRFDRDWFCVVRGVLLQEDEEYG
jgi:hypothetical protein